MLGGRRYTHSNLLTACVMLIGRRDLHTRRLTSNSYFQSVSTGHSSLSQLKHQVVASAGKLEVQVGKETKTFGITRAHLEEDAGKTLDC